MQNKDVLKKPNQKSAYSVETFQHLEQCVNDPVYFTENFVRIQHPVKGDVPFVLYPYQKKMLEAFHKHRFNCALTARQMGKALALDTPIPTPTGWTTMGDIKVGDFILGDDGHACRVSYVTEVMHRHNCFEVEFDNGDVIIADADHLWKVEFSKSSRIKNREAISTNELLPLWQKSKRLRQSVSVRISEAIQLPETDLPIHPYVLGVWLGDGYAAGGRFCGSTEDLLEISGHIVKAGYDIGKISFDKRNGLAMANIVGLSRRLTELELRNNKAIPKEYLRASIEQRLDLVRGLMDTDGSADKNGGMEFYNKNLGIVQSFRELLSSLGVKSRISSRRIRDETYYKVRFCTNKYRVFNLTRKNLVVQSAMPCHRKNEHFYIKNIRECAPVPVKCIQVDNLSHMFLCGRTMIPTHNTTTAAAYILWRATFRPNTTILIVGNTHKAALEIVSRISFAYEFLPDYLRAGSVEYNKGNLSFDNGSRIVSRATTPSAGRGLAISLLYCDEFAFLQPNMAREFWTSIQPTLSTGGDCIITSTPKSDVDQFSDIWKGACDIFDEYGNPRPNGVGRNNFYATKVTWDEHPERDEEWAKPFRETLGEARFKQEFECSFVTDDETLIDSMRLSRMRHNEPIFYTGTVRWFAEPKANRTYLVGLDPSLGTGGDYGTIQVFEAPSMTQVAEWQHNRTDPRGQVRVLMQILLFLQQTLMDDPDQLGTPDIFWTVENNTIGEAILTIIESTGEEKFPGVFVSEKKRKGQSRRFRKGLNTDNRKKLSACARFKTLVEANRMVINSQQLLKELKNFVRGGGSFKAKPGEHDDLVMAALLCVRMLDTVSDWLPEEDANLLKHTIGDDELFAEPMPIEF